MIVQRRGRCGMRADREVIVKPSLLPGSACFSTLAALLLAACSAPAGGGAGASGGAGIGGGTGGDLIDPTGPGSGGTSAAECKNVDLLFVVDNSASMDDNQDSLISSFPGFVSAIKQQLAGAESYHIGVVTTDAYLYNQPGCTAIGDLVTRTGGVASSDAVCGPFGGTRRYMDDTDANLGAAFACSAKVGVSGDDDERVARALIQALDPEKNAPGGCNEGFSRLDSLLVIVLITDEDDAATIDPGCPPNTPPMYCQKFGSGGTPEEWYSAVIAAKGGIPENVVVLSLLGNKKESPCDADLASRLINFTGLFGSSGFTGDICSSSYDEFFAKTLPLVDQACAGYVEPK